MGNGYLVGMAIAIMILFGLVLGWTAEEGAEAAQQSEYCARVAEYQRSTAAGEYPRGHRDYLGVCNDDTK